MKKVVGRKKIEDTEKSQPNILSFFTKTTHSKLALKKPKKKTQNESDNVAATSQSILPENSSKIVGAVGKLDKTELAMKDDRNHPQYETAILLSKDEKPNNFEDRQVKENKCRNAGNVNKTVVNLLTKGKHHLNNDHCVPNIVTENSPSKKMKLSSKKNSPHKKNSLALNSVKEIECVDFNNFNNAGVINTLNNEEKVIKDFVVGDNIDKPYPKSIDAKLKAVNFEEDFDCKDHVQHNSDEILKENLNPQLESVHIIDNPKKSGEPLDNLGCNIDEFSDLFEDDWNFNDFNAEESTDVEELDLLKWQRCEIMNITSDRNVKIVKLKEAIGTKSGTCSLEGSWTHAEINVGDTVSLIAHRQDERSGFKINNEEGYLVQWPDTLVSGTEIVGSIFCKRKAVLQHRFKGIDCNNKAMVIGSLVHQLLQTSLSNGLRDVKDIRKECKSMLNSLDSVYMLYEADMSQDAATEEMMQFAPPISHFICKYVLDEKEAQGKRISGFDKKDHRKKPTVEAAEWDGTINRIVDIEENIWSPRLGVKGKVDVTVEVTIHNSSEGPRERLMPLELKTGKASLSSEHRGQVILYTMLMTAIASGDTKDIGEGLLLYLRNSIGIHQVNAGRSEKRDLLMLRNQLAYYIANWCKPSITNTIKSEPERSLATLQINQSDSERINKDIKCELMELPEPINHHSACGRCPYATICSIHLSKDSTVELSSSHPMRRVMPDSIGHLSSNHIDYFLRFCQLLAMEDREVQVQNPLKDIWTLEPREREKRGKCLINMRAEGNVVPLGDRFEHTLRRQDTNKDSHLTEDIRLSSLQSGEYIILSTENKIAVSAGTIIHIDRSVVRLLLDRDITKRNPPSTLYYLDYYESQSLNLSNLTNLGVLMDQTEVSERLRRIVIDKEAATFSTKITRHVVDKGKCILSKLNKVQQRAVLKALSSNDYMLIKGMPGTGKTQTIVALVELLIILGKSVLITSQTHSAVDNVLMRLRQSDVKILRLGASSRIHQKLQPCSEAVLIKGCKSPEDLHNVYMSANVVGVTCLGAKHALLTKRTFDVCIIDESTQVLQCTALRPLFAANKFILVGDSEQLPPIVRSKSARLLGLAESLFDRLDSTVSTVNLNLQYRMNESIMNLANWFTYEGQLQCANDTVRMATLAVESQVEILSSETWLMPCISTKLNDSVVIIDTGNSASLLKQYGPAKSANNQPRGKHANLNNRHKMDNVCEAALVVSIIKELMLIGVGSGEIGVITPFRDQVALLQKCVSKMTDDCKHAGAVDSNTDDEHCDKVAKSIDIEVNTVDQYQGRDKQVIIYSCAKTWDLEKNRLQEFSENDILNDKRRLTVALTRAKHKLIIIGDVATLRFYKPFNHLFQGASLRKKNSTEDTITYLDLKKCHEFVWSKVMNVLSQE